MFALRRFWKIAKRARWKESHIYSPRGPQWLARWQLRETLDVEKRRGCCNAFLPDLWRRAPGNGDNVLRHRRGIDSSDVKGSRNKVRQVFVILLARSSIVYCRYECASYTLGPQLRMLARHYAKVGQDHLGDGNDEHGQG